MATATEMQNAINKLNTNMTRFDGIVNGPASGTGSLVGTDNGSLPTIARWFDTLAGAVIPIYPTISAAQAATISAQHNVIRINGRTAAGVGGAWWVRSLPGSTNPFRFADATGAYWEPTRDPATIDAVGATTTGLTVTVGVGGNFIDLQTALDTLTNFHCGPKQTIDLLCISPLTSGFTLMNGDWSRFRIRYSGTGNLPVAANAANQSNYMFEDNTANTITSFYKSTACLFVGLHAHMPRLSCRIDMNSPRGTLRYGHGIAIQGGSIHIDGGCGVTRAGLCGLSAQNSNVYAIGHDFSLAGAENIRIQQATTVTLQSGVCSGGGVEHSTFGSSYSGSQVFISRASSANVTGMTITNAVGNNIEFHGAFFRGADMTITGAAQQNVRMQIGSFGTLQGSTITGAGVNNVELSHLSMANLGACDLSAAGNYSLALTGTGGGVANMTNCRTKSSTNSLPRIEDVDGVQEFNWPGMNGIVYANVDGPLQRFGLLNNGTYSDSGASNGKTFKASSASVIFSSRDTASTATHYALANPNGVVANIVSAGSGGSIANVSDEGVKANVADLDAELDALEVIRNLRFRAYNTRRGFGGPVNDERRHGIVWQEAKGILPAQWMFDREGEPGDEDFMPASVDYVGVGYYAGAGLQKLDHIVADLLARIEDLEARL